MQGARSCRKLQAATGQPPDVQAALRVSKAALRTAAFQEEVVAQVRFPLCTAAAAGCSARGPPCTVRQAYQQAVHKHCSMHASEAPSCICAR